MLTVIFQEENNRRLTHGKVMELDSSIMLKFKDRMNLGSDW